MPRPSPPHLPCEPARSFDNQSLHIIYQMRGFSDKQSTEFHPAVRQPRVLFGHLSVSPPCASVTCRARRPLALQPRRLRPRRSHPFLLSSPQVPPCAPPARHAGLRPSAGHDGCLAANAQPPTCFAAHNCRPLSPHARAPSCSHPRARVSAVHRQRPAADKISCRARPAPRRCFARSNSNVINDRALLGVLHDSLLAPLHHVLRHLHQVPPLLRFARMRRRRPRTRALPTGGRRAAPAPLPLPLLRAASDPTPSLGSLDSSCARRYLVFDARAARAPSDAPADGHAPADAARADAPPGPHVEF